jgi:hypothetical protein
MIELSKNLKNQIMLKNILKLEGAQKLSSSQQKEINGGACIGCGPKKCGGDGSFIFVNGVKTCCYLPATNNYLC